MILFSSFSRQRDLISRNTVAHSRKHVITDASHTSLPSCPFEAASIRSNAQKLVCNRLASSWLSARDLFIACHEEIIFVKIIVEDSVKEANW